MVCKNQLAAIDFNLGPNLELSGWDNFNFSKITTTWSIEPIKVNKSKNKFVRMINRVVSILESCKIISLPEIPILPKNIAPGDRPIKEEVSCNQISRSDISYYTIKFFILDDGQLIYTI